MSSVLCLLVLFRSWNGWDCYSATGRGETRKGLEFYPPDVFCTCSEPHMMYGFINELCALFTWSFSFIWACLHLKSTRSAMVLKLGKLRMKLKRWAHSDSMIPLLIIFICHLHARLPAKVPSTHDWLTIWCYLVFLWNTCDTLTTHWWLMSWTLPIDGHDTVVCSI